MNVTGAYTRHQHAVAAYLAGAANIDVERWQAERSTGKWSPAEITAHLTLGFRALQLELGGGPPMAMRVGGWKLYAIRWKFMRQILADGRFPSGARAPRETRPEGADTLTKSEALEQLRAAASAFEDQILSAQRARPRTTLTHPYFGKVSLAQALFISAKHIEHHLQQVVG